MILLQKSGEGARMRRFTILALVCALAAVAAGCSSSSLGGQSIGNTVYVDSGGGTPTPAGVTRHDFDSITKAITAKDEVGLEQLIGTGVVVMVPTCAPAKLLDTALAGERQVRVVSTGAAVWVDANWLKNKASDCGG